MGHRVPASLAVAVLLSLVTAPLAGQSSDDWSLSRTPWGHPDLQGMWANNNATPLQRPEEFAGKETLTDDELVALKQQAAEVLDGGDAFFGDDFVAATVADGTDFRSFDNTTGNYNQFWIVEREFENRTSLIVDPPNGRLPPMTPEGQKRRNAALQGFLGVDVSGPEDTTNSIRCITYGVPNILAGYNSYFQILQTPEHVAIHGELIHNARIIPLDNRPHLPDAIRQWHGDPRGHWEGDTLVVESTNFSPESHFRGAAENLHLTERFTRLDAETIAYEITVDDPTTFTKPWTAMIPWKASPDAIFEYACHEGNIAMEGILKGARADEAAEQASKK